MANTFFGFDTALNNESNLLPDDDADLGVGEEDEYDALNDETFGSLGDNAALNDDWEEQHQQYAHYDENSKHSERIENSIRDLVLDDSDDEELLPKTTPASKADWYYGAREQHQQQPRNGSIAPKLDKILDIPHIPTVEEIEKLFASNKLAMHPPPSQPHHQNQQKRAPAQQHQQQPPPRFPPGFLPQPPHVQRMPPGFPNCMPGMRPLPGRYPMPMMHPGMPLPPQMQPYHGGPPMPPNFPAQLRSAPPGLNIAAYLTPQRMQQLRRAGALYKRQEPEQRHHQQQAKPPRPRDEYDGLMTSREKQWLLNIQHLQLNTGTPYFDDYYYTVFKERRARDEKESVSHAPQRHHHQHHHHHHHQQQQQQQRARNNSESQLQARTYTPLQFENSLGKLQCVSVTAPRKIIDTDVVTLEKDAESAPAPRDTRKTKQLLLDLEALYASVLKAEDLLNPLAIASVEKLVELRQKQRLREMEAAPTPAAKQELLRLLRAESTPQRDCAADHLLRIAGGLLQEEKFAAFMNIRKGKMLLLRLLPLLGTDYSIDEYATLWRKVLLCVPLVGRRDTVGDNLLPRLHPHFKRFVQTTRMADVLAIVGKLEQGMRATEGRCTPLGHVNKAPLQFVVANKFGVSALVTILVRTEYLISAGNATGEQVEEWATFLQHWADATGGRGAMMATPLEVIPRPVFVKHANRFARLGDEKRALLERHYVDIN